MTKIIGITGGIGSGKTMVAKYIQSLGIPVYIADEEAKVIMESKEITEAIVTEFGNVIKKEGVIDRSKLAKIVFKDSEKLKKLNSIIHPKVKVHFDNWVEKHKNYPFVFKEAAILFESGSYQDCDAVITVTAPINIRIARVIERDATTKESVMDRINSQWTDEQRIAKSDYVIHNISVNDTYNQTNKILKLLENN